MLKPLLFDSTLRDGSHAVKHQFSKAQIAAYCRRADQAGFHTIIVGHGNGLGSSSLQIGLSRLSDAEMLETAARHLNTTRLGAFLIPGFGTIKDSIKPAIDRGVSLVCVASHCTEADVTRQHIEYLANNGVEAYGVLMMHHMAETGRIVREARKMQAYGAQGVLLMDSAGSSTLEMVENRVHALKSGLDIRVGFHAHNNLGLAVANSYMALQAGADIIDGTIRGLGAGAGNCPLEVLVGLLEKRGMEHGINLYTAMDLSEQLVAGFYPRGVVIDSDTLISGIAGVFSGFLHKVKKAADEFSVDSRDIFVALGRKKVIAGQEDRIVEVAKDLAGMSKGNGTNSLGGVMPRANPAPARNRMVAADSI